MTHFVFVFRLFFFLLSTLFLSSSPNYQSITEMPESVLTDYSSLSAFLHRSESDPRPVVAMTCGVAGQSTNSPGGIITIIN